MRRTATQKRAVALSWAGSSMPPRQASSRPFSVASVSPSGGAPSASSTCRAAVVCAMRARQRPSFSMGAVSASMRRAAPDTAWSFSCSMIWSKPNVIQSCVMGIPLVRFDGHERGTGECGAEKRA